ncbi:MAG: hypothetical protein AMJ90_04895 [candidate division Zixibacteria bacterium SM23_73_2]|nr:MAG: hypothetical protein AMJ90_04895 [candidate division Zixibacteria bacterium SM23_73_2]
MFKPYFDIRDVFRAPRLALSGKKIMIQFFGLLIGYLGYMVFTYLSYLLSGISLSDVWESYKFLPLVDFTFANWYSWLVFLIGVVFFVFCWLLASAAVGKVTYEQLKGDEFYSAKDSLKFLKKHGQTVLASPLFLIGVAIILILGGIVIGLLGKIPYVGELGLGVFFGVPIFAVALVCVYVIFILVFSFFLAPAIVATTKEDIFEIIVQLFSTIWNQPWRYFLYTGVVLVLAKIGAFVSGYFCYRAVQLINWSCGIFMGIKLVDITDEALSYINFPEWFFGLFTNVFPGIDFRFHLPETGWEGFLSWSESISAFLIGITLILVIFGVLSYALATLSTGQTITYIILRRKKDEENLLERKTEEEEEQEKLEEEEKEQAPEEQETEKNQSKED